MTQVALLSAPRYNYLKNQLLQLDSQFLNIPINSKQFPDGEHYWRLANSRVLRKQPAVYLADATNDSAIFELYNIASALVQQQCSELHLVLPYLGYSTMERTTAEGEIVTAKNLASLLSAIPTAPHGNFIYLVDIHSTGTLYYFERTIHPIHLTAAVPLIQQLITDIAIDTNTNDNPTPPILASTDMGRAKLIEHMGNQLHLHTAYMMKKRYPDGRVAVQALNADVCDQTVIIFDDMIRSGSSLIQAARAYHEVGAAQIYVAAVHGVFTPDALDAIQQSGLIQAVYCTNSHPNAQCATWVMNANSNLDPAYTATDALSPPLPFVQLLDIAPIIYHNLVI